MNSYDEGLLKAAELQQRVIDSLPAAAAVNAGGAAPWVSLPDGAQPFDFKGIIVTPAKDGAEYNVLSVPVPFGWDGVIKAVSCNYTGGGFVQGSGDLKWRLRSNRGMVKNYDSILFELGSPSIPREVYGIRLYSGQSIEFGVVHATTSSLATAGTNIICTLAGWFYPRG